MNLTMAASFDDYVDQQLDHVSIDDSTLENFLQTKFPSVYEPTTQAVHDKAQQLGVSANQELVEWTIYQYLFSKKLLFNRMAHFWTNHFSIDISTGKALKTLDDRVVIRGNAHGEFKKMGSGEHTKRRDVPIP